MNDKVAINQMVDELNKTILEWKSLSMPIKTIEKLEWIKMNCKNWLNSITYQSDKK